MRQIVAPLFALVVIVMLWHLGEVIINPSQIVLPSPMEVASSFEANWRDLLWHTGITLLEALAGFFVAFIMGYGLAISFVLAKPVEEALYPFAIALKAMPLVALAPILVVWLGQGFMSKVVMAALVAFFPILVSSVDGLNSMNRDLVRLFDSYRASKWQRLRYLQIPASMDATFSGLKIASTLAVVGAVIAEFTGSSAGIGFLIKLGAYNLDTALMMASVFCIGLAGISIFVAISTLHPKNLRNG